MEADFAGEFRMDLSPPSAPVYGGGLIEIGLFGDLELPEFVRLFLIFDGSKQRQVTEAKIIKPGRLQAVIPDHEPPEIVALSLIVKFPSSGPCRTISQGTFTYFLDQTCYLARYLADSVHDLGALEDWDFIRGPQFSLANEDFPTLDERLTSAFQHLILPPTWNLLGDPSSAHISRETLFHFAARLGLSSLVTLLLEKNGATECLQIRNNHNELAENIARSKRYDGLADLITDPHAHGVIRWESTQRLSPVTTIKRHSFGTVTTSTEMHNGDFPPIEEEIESICKDHPPPPPDKPSLEIETVYNNGVPEEDFPPPPEDIDLTNTTDATWGSDPSPPLDFIPPPVPPKPDDLYADYEYDGEENGDNSEYTQNETSSYFSPTSYIEDSPLYPDPESLPEDENSEGILDDNLHHLQKIASDIRFIRQKDIARLKQSSPTEAVRLSNSCPDLGQESSFNSTDADYLEAFDSPAAARSRQGLAIQNYDAEFQTPIGPYNSSDDLLSQPHNRSPVYLPEPQRALSDDERGHAEVNMAGDGHFLKVSHENVSRAREEDDSDDDDDDDDRAVSPSRRPHSWHSVEKLNEIKPGIVPKQAAISHKRSQSYQGDESSSMLRQHSAELTPEERAEQADTITSPSIRRVRRHNNNAFAVVGQDNRMLKARSSSVSINNNNNALEPDRRFTISEGTISDKHRESLLALQELIRRHDPANFETDEDSPAKPKPAPSSSMAPKPYAPPRPDGPASKNIVSRKLSFLTKMRSSTRAKAAVVKDRAKKLSDPKANSIIKQLHGDDNLTDTKDSKETQRDFSWHAVKNKNKKGATTQNSIRPSSMMISKLPTTYASSLPNNGSYFVTERVHGLPVRQNFSRPITQAYESSRPIESSVMDGKYSKGSYKDDGDSTSLHSESRTPPHLSHNAVSGSIESIDEAVDLAELENDPDLMIRDDEPEAWSVTVEKKFLNKMHKKDIKRQDNIFEFIQKERNFLTTLKIMQKIFAQGMSKELQYDQDTIDKLFPKIDEFVEYTSSIVQQLDDRQREGQLVSRIGDILLTQWSEDNGLQMQGLFEEFCSKQQDIILYYKDLMKNDKKFQDFIRKCGKNQLTRRRDIPGCILLVTQRITKYPVILKTLIDNSNRKEHKSDVVNLNNALQLITDIIKKVDKHVLEYEKTRKVNDIHSKMETKTYATYKDGRKFTREDFSGSIHKLLQVGTLQWKPNSMKRPIDVTVVLFKDLLVFLQENNQRYSFASVGQPAAVPLHKLIVREKAGEDSVLFLLSASSDQPEMYELQFQTSPESKSWMQWIRGAVDACPEEDEGVSYQDVEEQRLMEQKWVQAQKLITELEKRDKEINDILQHKMKNFKKLATVLERPEITVNMKYGYPNYILDTDDPKSTKAPSGAPTLQKAIEQVNKLAQAMCGPGGLNRNPSSVGEHDSGTYHTPSLPKRSETFGGFDNGKEPPSPRTKWATMGPKSSGSKQDFSDESRRDSGLIESDMSQASSEQQIPGYSSYNSLPHDTVSRGQGGMILPPSSDQISALAQLTHLMNEYLSIATQQDTQVQKMASKLIQSQTRRANGSRFLEVEARRNQAKQTELEQDLQKREESLKTEREQWNRHYRRFQSSMEVEQAEMEERLLKLKSSEEEVQRQHEEVRRAKDECQRQMARLREIQRKTEQGVPQSASYPSNLGANRNNSNSAAILDDEDTDENQNFSKPFGHGLGSMPQALSKSHSSLEGELSSGENSVSKESSHSPTYSNAGDYPKTFPGTGKRDQTNNFIPPQQHHSVQPPVAGSQANAVPLHLKYSATNQLLSHAAPPRHSVIPTNLSSKSKSVGHQVIPNKLKSAGLANAPSSQSSTKQSLTDGIKSKLPFHHKKTPRSNNSSSDLNDTKSRSNTLTLPNNLKHSKSEANMEVSNIRNRSTSSPSPVTSLYPPPTDSESGLERSNSASSNSSKEGTEKKSKKGKRRSWGSNGEKPNEKEIYF